MFVSYGSGPSISLNYLEQECVNMIPNNERRHSRVYGEWML